MKSLCFLSYAILICANFLLYSQIEIKSNEFIETTYHLKFGDRGPRMRLERVYTRDKLNQKKIRVQIIYYDQSNQVESFGGYDKNGKPYEYAP